jgi:hypothetical protein
MFSKTTSYMLTAFFSPTTGSTSLASWFPSITGVVGILKCWETFNRSFPNLTFEMLFPGLQHDFCALWNKFTREAQNTAVLRSSRHLFIALHQGTDATPTAFDASTMVSDPVLHRPSSYPLCNVPGHHSDGATDETTHSLIFSTPIHVPDADLNNIALAAPDVPSFPAFTPDNSRIHLTEQSSPRGVPHATPIIQPSHLSSPLNVGNSNFATTLPDPALTIATESHADIPFISPMDNSESDIRPGIVTLTAISPSLPSGGAVDQQYKTDLDIDPLVLGIPSSSSPVPISSDTFPADSLISSVSPTSQIDRITPGSKLLTLGSAPDISSRAC